MNSFAWRSLVGMVAAAPVAAAALPLAARAAESSEIEEVVVTAQLRKERFLDVPVSVTALTSKDLERAQLSNMKSLMTAVPALTASKGNFGNSDLLIGLRGLKTPSSLINVDSAVGLYVNGIYYARTAGANVAFTDIEQIEVLRGPQGTLFGRNTIGGAVTITTKAPADKFEGSVKVGYGNYENFTASGVVNIPIIADKLTTRFVYDHQEHSGYVKAVTQPIIGDRDFTDQNQDYFRGTVKFTPNEVIDLQVVGDYLHIDQNSDGHVLNFFDHTAGSAATSRSQPNLLPAAARMRFFNAFNSPIIDPKSRTTNAQFNPRNHGSVYDIAATLNVNLGRTNIKSITGYRNIDLNLPQDIDGRSFSLVEQYIYYNTGDEFSQEIQISGTAFGDKLSWVGGAYYFRETNDNVFSSVGAPPTANLTSAFSPTGAFLPGSTLTTAGMLDARNTSKSIFAQVTYELFPKVRVTGGVRYVRDTRGMTYLNQVADALSGAVLSCSNLSAASLSSIAAGCTFKPGSLSSSYVPWTAGLDFKPNDDALIFAKVSKGYRAGGLQQCCGAGLPYYDPFRPEQATAYEVGAKAALFDRRLRIGVSAYNTRYSDVQQGVPTINPANNAILFSTRNTGTASIWGGELELTALIQDLRINANLGVIDAKFTGGPYVGSPFTDTPETSWAASATYPIKTSWGVIELNADYSWQSSRFFITPVFTSGGVPFLDIFSPEQKAAMWIPSYGLLNAMASATIDGRYPVTLSVWGRNLAGKHYWASTFTGPTSAINFYNVARPGEPRTYGVSLALKF